MAATDERRGLFDFRLAGDPWIRRIESVRDQICEKAANRRMFLVSAGREAWDVVATPGTKIITGYLGNF
jgi:hypothetical protein